MYKNIENTINIYILSHYINGGWTIKSIDFLKFEIS